MTEINDETFLLCTGLTSITIPGSVTEIGKNVFEGCTGLTNITIPNSVTRIGVRAFSGCTSITSIIIPGSVTRIGEYAFIDCENLKEVTIEEGNLESIRTSAFKRCTKLKTVINNSQLIFIKGASNNGYIAYYADEVKNKQDKK